MSPIVEERLQRLHDWMRDNGYSASSVVTNLSQLRFLLRGWVDLEDPGAILQNFNAAPFTRQPSLLSAWRSLEKACVPPNDLYLPTIPEFEARTNASGRPRLAGGEVRDTHTAPKREKAAPVYTVDPTTGFARKEPVAGKQNVEPELVSAAGITRTRFLQAAHALYYSLPQVKADGSIAPVGVLAEMTWGSLRKNTEKEMGRLKGHIAQMPGRSGERSLDLTLVFNISESGMGIEAAVLTNTWTPIFQILTRWCGLENANRGAKAFMFPARPDTAGPSLTPTELRRAFKEIESSGNVDPTLKVERTSAGDRTQTADGRWERIATEGEPTEQQQMRKTVGALSRLNISSTVFAMPQVNPPPPRPPAPAPVPDALGPTPSSIIQPVSPKGTSPAEDT